jgi:Iron dependent repressor, metal binding and dimerisation domain
MPMSAHVLVSGALFCPPEQRTSKASKPFVTATIRVKDGDPSAGSGQASQWWKVLAFSETVQRDGLVTSKPYRSIFLTEKGQELAKTARERHRVVREFQTALGVDAKTADTDAEGIEHHVSDATLRVFRGYIAKQRRNPSKNR